MNVNKSPLSLTPAYNPVIYQFGSTYSQALFFDVTIYDSASNGVIVQDRTYITPVSPTQSSYNISDVARNLVKWQIVNNTVILQPITDSVRKIYLEVEEWGMVGLTMSQLSATQSLSDIRIWNGQLNRVSFGNYAISQYEMSASTTSAKFLTTKPNYYALNNKSREFLYYLKEPNTDLQVNIKKWTMSNTLYDNKNITLSSTASMMRIDVSPKLINSIYSNFFQEGYQYSVSLSISGNTKSESKWYNYKLDKHCNLEYVNVLWENHLGGIDAYQFIQPVETRTVERAIQEKYAYDWDNNNNFVDRENAVFNQTERIINTNLTSQFKCFTKPLTDEENVWLAGLLSSKNVWIELNDGKIFPITIAETSYTINKIRYNRLTPLQSEWTFKILKDWLDENNVYAGTSITGAASTPTPTPTPLPATATPTPGPATATPTAAPATSTPGPATATPTPGPATATPTPTSACCNEYGASLTNTTAGPLIIAYDDCFGIAQTYTIPIEDIGLAFTFCGCDAAITSGNGSLNNLGPC